ncbi:MAG: GNAT family N-acetyltransferase [Anaerolineae bacterium]
MSLSSDTEQIKAGLVSPTKTGELRLVVASEFDIDTLTNAYNQARVDYIVPMPMNSARLQEYVDNYDVDLTRSVVAMLDDDILGLAMLGVRSDHTWITRLGVLPNSRRMGAGEAMMRYCIAQSRDLGVDHIILEVIENNVPAHRLFRKLGFEETRDLLILRRPPGPPEAEVPPYEVAMMGGTHALALLRERRSRPSWLDEYRSLRNAGNLFALTVELQNGGAGWLVYQSTVFQLGRLVPQTERGNPYDVAQTLCHALHSQHPIQDTKTENMPSDDPHLEGFKEMGYFESFRRIEMRLDLNA